ncbi:hypothetical protein [Embleya sp. AB8]|uniref:hypothetical protein n=1 Tax=Embleya sp. AB8 TaxID=3156304 RepID=UPI003C75E839
MSIFKRRSGARPALPALVLVKDAAAGDAEIAAARDTVVRTGDHTAAEAILARVGRDWDRRHLCVDTLAEAALDSPQWFTRWAEAAPESPDLLVLAAQVALDRAWQARGGGYARHTSAEAFAEFGRLLVDAETACMYACEAAGDDPTPWVTRLWVGIGRRSPREVFDARWDELVARDPHNRNAHLTAIQFLAAKWYGSHEEMYAFARTHAEAAPAGSPLALLVLRAHIEYMIAESDSTAFSLDDFWAHPAVTADTDDARARYTLDGGPRRATWLLDHSLLGFAYALSERWHHLGRELLATDGHVTDQPWSYLSAGFRDVAHEQAARAVRRRPIRAGR